MAIYRPGKEIIRAKLENATVGEISNMLDVHPAHIYNVEDRGVSPTLYKALIKVGWLDPPLKVYTLAFRFHCREDFERARAALAEYDGKRTEWLMEQLDAAIGERGDDGRND